MWKALEYYMQKDHAAEWREWESRIGYIRKQLTDIPGVKLEPFVPEIANESPHLRVSWDMEKIPFVYSQITEKLRQGDPRIEVRPGDAKKPTLDIAVWMLAPGEHKLVAQRVRQVLLESVKKG